MTRDLIIGLIVSVSLHGSIFFYEKIFPKQAEVVATVVEEEFTVALMEMPPLEPEPEDIIEATDDAPPKKSSSPLRCRPTCLPSWLTPLSSRNFNRLPLPALSALPESSPSPRPAHLALSAEA